MTSSRYQEDAMQPARRSWLNPGDAAERVELYVRTFRTLLRSAGETRLRTLERPHAEMFSSLHAGAADRAPDLGALIYAMQRLPAAISAVAHVVMGQSVQAISAAVGEDVSGWRMVSAPGRRRRWLWDGGGRIAVLVASETDVDDLVPTLVALQIEWNKLHVLLQRVDLAHTDLLTLWRRLDVSETDWAHVLEIAGESVRDWLMAVAKNEKDLRVRTVGGTHVGFAHAVRQWWQPIRTHLQDQGLDQRPLYFVSSNTHSLANLISGVAAEDEERILAFVERENHPELAPELDKLRTGASRASWANFLYFAARHYFGANPSERLRRTERERAAGIAYIAPEGAVDVAAQIIPLKRTNPGHFDTRLGAVDEDALLGSNAVILNIDYPLGLAAYRILRVIAEDIEHLAGVYVLGKAATLNASVGDVLVSNAVWDEHTGNTYWLDNCFGAEDVAPYLVFGSALDGQQAVTVLGTFLQNRGHLETYYREMYTVVEMEAGPYLSAVYEASHPTRHPMNEHVSLTRLPFDLGILHYASDTPYTQARTLGARGLSYRGMDSTYAGAVAILRRILSREGLLAE
jgi:hypothetical protein